MGLNTKKFINIIAGKWIILVFLIITVYFILFTKSPANITLNNWYEATLYEKNNTIEVLQELFKNSKHKFKEIQVYSIKGEPNINKTKDILTVQFSGESIFKDPSQFDISFISGKHTQNNIIPMPYMVWSIYLNQIDMHAFTRRRIFRGNNQKSFCLFSVSNPTNIKRNNFFTALSRYKTVDSCGKVMNNMGYSCPGVHYSSEFHKFISNYKFMICFENLSQENYLTEKLSNAYSYGTIPIYWGCPNIGDYINMSSILYLKPNYSEDDMNRLIKEIEILDNDDTLYRQKYESIFFKDGVVPDAFDIGKIQNKIDSLVDKKLTEHNV